MMRRRFRWVGAVVVVSALAGAAVAITDAPAATSTTPEHHVAGAIAGDALSAGRSAGVRRGRRRS